MSEIHYTYTLGQKYCTLHGTYWGTSCPGCNTSVYIPTTNPITPSPVPTEDALGALVRVYDSIIKDLREQVAERDRQIDALYQELDELREQHG